MNLKGITLVLTSLVAAVMLTGCASGYQTINPKTINYVSNSTVDDVALAYKYDLLNKKYGKKELKKGVKLVAVKITNSSDRDLVFGQDLKLTYGNGNEIVVMDNEEVFQTLKQSPASYLWYLLLTPINFYTTETNSMGQEEQTSSTPIGLVIGPGLAGGNMIAAGSANKKFKTEMLQYNINGTTVKKGDTIHGLIGIRTEAFDAISLKVVP